MKYIRVVPGLIIASGGFIIAAGHWHETHSLVRSIPGIMITLGGLGMSIARFIAAYTEGK